MKHAIFDRTDAATMVAVINRIMSIPVACPGYALATTDALHVPGNFTRYVMPRRSKNNTGAATDKFAFPMLPEIVDAWSGVPATPGPGYAGQKANFHATTQTVVQAAMDAAVDLSPATTPEWYVTDADGNDVFDESEDLPPAASV